MATAAALCSTIKLFLPIDVAANQVISTTELQKIFYSQKNINSNILAIRELQEYNQQLFMALHKMENQEHTSNIKVLCLPETERNN